MKNIKLKKECFQCGYFNEGHKHYKCAVKSSCPGINWSKEKKLRALKRGYHGDA